MTHTAETGAINRPNFLVLVFSAIF